MRQAASSTASLQRENTSLKSSNQSLREEVTCHQEQVNKLSRVVEQLEEVSVRVTTPTWCHMVCGTGVE